MRAEDEGVDALAQLLQPMLEVDTPYLRIEWPSSLIAPTHEGEDAATSPKITAAACSNLGEALLAGKGSWGLGIFSRFGCYYASDKDKLLGTPFAGVKAEKAVAWTLRLVKEGGDLQLQVYYQAPDGRGPPVRVALATAPASVWTQDLLRDRNYAALLAGIMSDAMPAVRRFPPVKDPQAKTVDIPVEDGQTAAPRLPSLRPKSLTLFTWSFNPHSRLWMPHVIGTATVVKEKTKLSWHLNFSDSPGTRPIFAQSPKGPGTYQKPLTKQLAKQQSNLLTNSNDEGFAKIRDGVASATRFLLLNTIDAGYIGVRVGRELIDPKTAIIPPATVIGVTCEIRTGFAAGLRVYLDYVPRHGSTQNGEALWVQYSRLVAGYNFGLNFQHVVDRVELAPKIGIWNVNSRLAEFSDEDTNAVGYRAFNMTNALSLGFEAAAVWEGPSYLLRLWHGRDLSNPFLKVADLRRKVLSSRSGIDAMLKGPPVGLFGKQWRLSYLLFAYYETLTFSQVSSHGGNFELEFSSPYAGGGLSLAW